MEALGQLFVLSGPSGVGKSSLRERVRLRYPQLGYSVSHTTRTPRSGEVEGEDYIFVTAGTFLAMVDAGAFVEWAQVHDHYYGTSREQLNKHLDNNRDVLLEIDVQGARQVKACYPDACFVFLLPPDWDTLERRLRLRGTEGESQVKSRLEQGLQEIREAPWYDYLVVNDTLDEASEALAAIILARRYRTAAALPRLLALIQWQTKRAQIE
jgi:guanylate kinase